MEDDFHDMIWAVLESDSFIYRPLVYSVSRFRVHVSTVTCVRFNEESTIGFSGSLDNAVHVWDLRAHNFHPIQSLKDAKDSITSLIVSCAAQLALAFNLFHRYDCSYLMQSKPVEGVQITRGAE